MSGKNHKEIRKEAKLKQLDRRFQKDIIAKFIEDIQHFTKHEKETLIFMILEIKKYNLISRIRLAWIIVFRLFK